MRTFQNDSRINDVYHSDTNFTRHAQNSEQIMSGRMNSAGEDMFHHYTSQGFRPSVRSGTNLQLSPSNLRSAPNLPPINHISALNLYETYRGVGHVPPPPPQLKQAILKSYPADRVNSESDSEEDTEPMPDVWKKQYCKSIPKVNVRNEPVVAIFKPVHNEYSYLERASHFIIRLFWYSIFFTAASLACWIVATGPFGILGAIPAIIGIIASRTISSPTLTAFACLSFACGVVRISVGVFLANGSAAILACSAVGGVIDIFSFCFGIYGLYLIKKLQGNQLQLLRSTKGRIGVLTAQVQQSRNENVGGGCGANSPGVPQDVCII